MVQPVKFWDKIADRYAKMPIEDEAAYQKKLAVTQSYLNPEMELLEFGCGTGSTALIHAPHVKQIRAIDFSSAMLDIARQKAADQGITNVSFEQASLEDLTVTEGSLDMVLGLSILHLLDDRAAAIAKVYQMLKPGGFFVSSTTCLGDTMPWFKFLVPLGKALGFFPPLQVIQEQAILDDLKGVGFTIEHHWLPAPGKAVFIIAQKPQMPQ
ncbi:MAG: class I SAM-dependent methyltransferase [Prochlorothrix sp.]